MPPLSFLTLILLLTAPQPSTAFCPSSLSPFSLHSPFPLSSPYLSYSVKSGEFLEKCIEIRNSGNLSSADFAIVPVTQAVPVDPEWRIVALVGLSNPATLFAVESLGSLGDVASAGLPLLVSADMEDSLAVSLGALGLSVSAFTNVTVWVDPVQGEHEDEEEQDHTEAHVDEEEEALAHAEDPLVERVLAGEAVFLGSRILHSYRFDAAVSAEAVEAAAVDVSEEAGAVTSPAVDPRALPEEHGFSEFPVPQDTLPLHDAILVREDVLATSPTLVSAWLEALVHGAIKCRDNPRQCTLLMPLQDDVPTPFAAIVEGNELIWRRRTNLAFGQIPSGSMDEVTTALGVPALTPDDIDLSIIQAVTDAIGTDATGASYTGEEIVDQEFCPAISVSPTKLSVYPCELNELFAAADIEFTAVDVPARIVQEDAVASVQVERLTAVDTRVSTIFLIVSSGVAPFLLGLLIIAGVWVFLKSVRYRKTRAVRRAHRARLREEGEGSSIELSSLNDSTTSGSHIGSGSEIRSTMDAADIVGARRIISSMCANFMIMMVPMAMAIVLLALGLLDSEISVDRQRMAQATIAVQGVNAVLAHSMAAHSSVLGLVRSAVADGRLSLEGSTSAADTFVSLAGPVFAAGTRGTAGWLALRYCVDALAAEPDVVTLVTEPESGTVWAVNTLHSGADGRITSIREREVADATGAAPRSASWTSWVSPSSDISEGEGWRAFLDEGSSVAKPYSLVRTEDAWSLTTGGDRFVSMYGPASPATLGLDDATVALGAKVSSAVQSTLAVAVGVVADTTHAIELVLDPHYMEEEIAALAAHGLLAESELTTPTLAIVTTSGGVVASSLLRPEVLDSAMALEGIDPELVVATPEELPTSNGEYVDPDTKFSWRTWQSSVPAFPTQLKVLATFQVDYFAEAPGGLIAVMRWMIGLVTLLVMGMLFLLAYRSVTNSREMVELVLRREAEGAKEKAEALARESIQALQTKNRFISVMSHELRNPLTGVTLNADLLLSTTELSDTAQDYVKGIARSAKMMLTIINDVLDVSKIESGRLEFESVAINLRELVDIVAKTVAPSAAKKGVSVGCYIPPIIRTDVLGDATRLRQVLHNLCGNATKFTEAGEIIINVHEVNGEKLLKNRGAATIAHALKLFDVDRDQRRRHGVHTGEVDTGSALESGEASGSQVTGDSSSSHSTNDTTSSSKSLFGGSEAGAPHRQRRLPAGVRALLSRVRYFHFQVVDSGIGIDETGIARLFKEFSQVDTSTTRKFGGSGLGLYICKQLVELQGGMIWVESVEGRGSTFQFILPFRPLSDTELAAQPRYPLSSVDNAKIMVNKKKKPLAGALRGQEGGTYSGTDTDDDDDEFSDGEDAVQEGMEYIRANLHRECYYEGPAGFNPRWRVCIAHSSTAISSLLKRVVETTLAEHAGRVSITVEIASATLPSFLKDTAQKGCGPEVTVLLCDEKLVNKKLSKAVTDAMARVQEHSSEVHLVAAMDVLRPLPRDEQLAFKKVGWEYILVRPLLPTTIVDMLCLGASAAYTKVHASKKAARNNPVSTRFSMLRGDTLRQGGLQDSGFSISDGSGDDHGASRKSPAAGRKKTGTVKKVDMVRTDGKILVVDDFELMRRVVATAVESLGYDVITASDGQEALNMMTDDRMNILMVFMDCEMPNMDGFEATRLLRDHEHRNSTQCPLPIVACTGNAMQEDKRKCAEAGMTGFAAKPLKRTLVEEMLNKYARNSTRGAPRSVTPTLKPRRSRKPSRTSSPARVTIDTTRPRQASRGVVPPVSLSAPSMGKSKSKKVTGQRPASKTGGATPRDPGDREERADSMRGEPPTLQPLAPAGGQSKRKKSGHKGSGKKT